MAEPSVSMGWAGVIKCPVVGGWHAKGPRTSDGVWWLSCSGMQASGLLLCVIYFVWLGILVERSLRHVGGMNPEYIFVMMITLVTIFGAMAAFFTGALAPDQVRAECFGVRRPGLVISFGGELVVSRVAGAGDVPSPRFAYVKAAGGV